MLSGDIRHLAEQMALRFAATDMLRRMPALRNARTMLA
jgi:hypothetical protein